MTRIGIILLRVEYTYTIWNSKMEYDLQRAKTSFFVTIAPTPSIRVCTKYKYTYIYLIFMYNYRKTKTKRIIPV